MPRGFQSPEQQRHAVESAAEALTTHGMSKTPFYRVYKSMMNRCYRPSSDSYKHYGARGITVDERWHNFENFKADMYESYLIHRLAHPNTGTSIERINNDLGYSPSNCCWATSSEQAKNRRMPIISRAARLTPKQVVNIRHCRGSIASRKLAALYGVSQATISDIWTGKSWRDMPVGEEYYR